MSPTENTRKLSFATLRIAREVMASKSLTKTARKLSISQPAVSLHLRKFEEAVGFSPVTRTGNEMVITSQEAWQVVNELLSLENDLFRLGSSNRRSLKAFGICQYWGIRLVTDIEGSKKLRSRFHLHVGCADQLWSSYIDGDIDAVIRPVRSSEDPIFSQELPLIWAGGSSNYSRVNPNPVGVILASKTSPFGRVAREWLAENNISYNIVMECDNPAYLGDLCRNLNAATLVPAMYAKRLGLAKADCLMESTTSCSMKVGLFFRENSIALSEAEDCFTDFVAQVEARLPYLSAAS